MTLVRQDRPDAEGSAQDLSRALDLRPHPEGGFDWKTWRDAGDGDVGARGAGAAIHFCCRVG